MYLRFLIYVSFVSYSQCWVNRTARQFKNGRQAVAMIQLPDTQQYQLAKPQTIADRLEFKLPEGTSIHYMCSFPSRGKDTIRAVHISTSNEYEYHECSAAPDVALRLADRFDPLARLCSVHQLHQIGYEIENQSQDGMEVDNQNKNSSDLPPRSFVPVISFIYDSDKSFPIFIKYHITSADPLLYIDTDYTMDYNTVNPTTGDQIPANPLYVRKYDMATEFQHLLDVERVKSKKTTDLAFTLGLLKRQLVSKDDLLLFPWKRVTFFDSLTAPMWKILRPKWDSVEQFVRRLANIIGDLEILAGASGVLTWNGQDEETTPRQSEYDARKAIPKLLWRAVINRDQKFGVLIVMHNYPLEEDKNLVCADIGYDNNWLFTNQDYVTGLIYACELNTDNMAKLLDSQTFNLDVLNLQELKSQLPVELLEKIIDNIY